VEKYETKTKKSKASNREKQCKLKARAQEQLNAFLKGGNTNQLTFK